MKDFIENNIKKTKIVLDYFGYAVSKEEIFLLSDLYKLRFNYDEYADSCPAEIASFRLFFFINHFISGNATKFCEELYEMKVTKNYPFPVIYRCGDRGNFAIIMGVRRKDKKIILLDKDNNMVLTEFDSLKDNLNGRVEWWVIMPSQKKISVSEVLRQCAYKSIRYMLNMLQGGKKDCFYGTEYLKEYADAILMVAESNNDDKLKEILSRYEIIAKNDRENIRVAEKALLEELYEYMG